MYENIAIKENDCYFPLAFYRQPKIPVGGNNDACEMDSEKTMIKRNVICPIQYQVNY